MIQLLRPRSIKGGSPPSLASLALTLALAISLSGCT